MSHFLFGISLLLSHELLRSYKLTMIHLPLMLLLSLRFKQMSLMLQDFHCPLILLLPLHFSQIGLMSLSFHFPFMLPLPLDFGLML
jgi:hypothetical protein